MPGSNLREIIFRARKLSTKEWVFGQMTSFDTHAFVYTNENDRYEVDMSTRGMYINLKDKNGDKVFEGDLLLANENEDTDVYVVVWRGCGFVGKHYSSERYINLITHEIEVVGQFYSSELERDLVEIKKKIELLNQGAGRNESV